MKFKLNIILVILIIFIAVGCGGEDSIGGTIVDILVTPSPITIANGDNKNLSTLLYIEGVNPDGSKNQIIVEECIWIVANTTILEVKSGKIIGKSQGTTTVNIIFSGLTKK
jgi:hypothetical protein